MYVRKINSFVKYPVKKLNISHWVLDGKQDDYDLFAIACHHSRGSTGGHFSAYIQSKKIEDLWIRCNDFVLSCVNEKNVVAEEAYILFYKRHTLSPANIGNLTFQ